MTLRISLRHLLLTLLLPVFIIAAAPLSAQSDLESCLLDLVIALDESPSIGPSFADDDDEFSFVIDFAVGLIEGLPVDEDNVNVGLVLFDGTAETLFPLTEDEELAVNTLESYDRGNTNGTGLARAINLSIEELASGRPAVQDIIVILADGDNNRPGNPVTSADNARSQEIQLFSVAVGDDLNIAQLQGVANDPDDEYFFQAEDFSDLDGLINSINRNACGAPSTLSGIVFTDADEDAQLDAGEPGAAGVTVRLYDAADLTTPAVPDQVSDATGAYTFQVSPGDYVVEIVTPPQPLVSGSQFDAATGRTGVITVGVSVDVTDINAPLEPAPTDTPTSIPATATDVSSTATPVIATATPVPATAETQGPSYIQFNHPDEISMTANERPQVTVQFGNIGQSNLTNLQVVCRITEGQARFTETIFTHGSFSSVEQGDTQLIFSGLAELPVGQNFNLSFVLEPVAGVSQVICELFAESALLGTDMLRLSVR